MKLHGLWKPRLDRLRVVGALSPFSPLIITEPCVIPPWEKDSTFLNLNIQPHFCLFAGLWLRTVTFLNCNEHIEYLVQCLVAPPSPNVWFPISGVRHMLSTAGHQRFAKACGTEAAVRVAISCVHQWTPSGHEMRKCTVPNTQHRVHAYQPLLLLLLLSPPLPPSSSSPAASFTDEETRVLRAG